MGLGEMTSDELAAAVERLADIAWPTIAALAWRRYLQEGRGAVIVPLSLVLRKENSTVMWMKSMAHAEITAAIEGYDPKAEVVLVVMDDDDFKRIRGGDAGVWKLVGWPSRPLYGAGGGT